MIYMQSMEQELASLDHNSRKQTHKIFKNIANYQMKLNTDDPRFKGGNLDDTSCIKFLDMLNKKKHYNN